MKIAGFIQAPEGITRLTPPLRFTRKDKRAFAALLRETRKDARTMTRAVDIDCPNGHAPAGTMCNGLGIGCDLCQARIINAAGKATREANKRRRETK